MLEFISDIVYDGEELNFPLFAFFTIVAVTLINKLFGDLNPLGRSIDLFKTFLVQESKRNINVNEFIDEYNELYSEDDNSRKEGAEVRNAAYATLVNAYYELVTLFYEWGWGQSFHFAYQIYVFVLT